MHEYKLRSMKRCLRSDDVSKYRILVATYYIAELLDVDLSRYFYPPIAKPNGTQNLSSARPLMRRRYQYFGVTSFPAPPDLRSQFRASAGIIKSYGHRLHT